MASTVPSPCQMSCFPSSGHQDSSSRRTRPGRSTPPDSQPSCYIRPLATIEPTAIRCQLPVNTRFGFTDIAGLEAELRKPIYERAVVFVSWEHLMLVKFVRHLVASLGGDPAQVQDWPSNDYDRIYVVRISTHDSHASVSFALDHEELGRLSDRFPIPAVSKE